MRGVECAEQSLSIVTLHKLCKIPFGFNEHKLFNEAQRHSNFHFYTFMVYDVDDDTYMVWDVSIFSFRPSHTPPQRNRMPNRFALFNPHPIKTLMDLQMAQNMFKLIYDHFAP